VAPVFPLRGGLLVLFSIQLLCLKFIRPGESLRRGSPTRGGVPQRHGLIRLKTTATTTGSKTSSDRCSSGSGAIWVFCLASGGLSGVIWIPFERRVSFGGPLGSLWLLLGAWAPPAPVWGPQTAFAFSYSYPGPGFHLVPLILVSAQEIIRLPSSRCILSPSSSGVFCVS
jgi:hypothetical protein